MGQRHQVYVINKAKEGYECIGAFHHQWCYGFTAASNLIELVERCNKAKTYHRKEWSEFTFRDPREVDVLVKAVYGINDDGSISMVHNENKDLIGEDGAPTPECGDNNDGAGLVIIDNDKQEVRGCLFTPGHVEGSHADKCKAWKTYTPLEYVAFYYTESETSEAADEGNPQAKAVLATKELPIKPITQAEFNKILKKSIGAK